MNTNLEARTKKYVLDVILFLNSLPKDYVCRTIGLQLLRAATSVGANYIEGRAASSRKDFINFLSHALKSANESKFWLELLRDSANADMQKVLILIRETDELGKILGACIITAKGKRRI